MLMRFCEHYHMRIYTEITCIFRRKNNLRYGKLALKSCSPVNSPLEVRCKKFVWNLGIILQTKERKIEHNIYIQEERGDK